MRRTYGQKAVNVPQSIPSGKQRHTNLVAKGPDRGPTQGLKPVKTRGRIGSPTPPHYVKPNFEVDNNRRMGPPNGPLGSNAAKHMSPSHQGGDQWQPYVAKARAKAEAGRNKKARPHAEPINAQVGPLKRVKPT